MKKLKKIKQQKEKNKITDSELLSGKLLNDNVLIYPINIDESINGLVNTYQYEDKPEFGEVLMVGDGKLLDNGTLIKPSVKVGDIVLFQKYSAQKIRVEGIDYLLIREEDIYWVK